MRKVLIVHSDVRLVGQLARALHEKDANVLTAHNGFEAMRRVQNTRPDVVAWGGKIEDSVVQGCFRDLTVPIVEIPAEPLLGAALEALAERILTAKVSSAAFLSIAPPVAESSEPAPVRQTPVGLTAPPTTHAFRITTQGMAVAPPTPPPETDSAASVANRVLTGMSGRFPENTLAEIRRNTAVQHVERKGTTGVLSADHGRMTGARSRAAAGPARKPLSLLALIHSGPTIQLSQRALLLIVLSTTAVAAFLYHGEFGAKKNTLSTLSDKWIVRISIEQRIALVDTDASLDARSVAERREKAKFVLERCKPQNVRRVVLVGPSGVPLASVGKL